MTQMHTSVTKADTRESGSQTIEYRLRDAEKNIPKTLTASAASLPCRRDPWPRVEGTSRSA